MAGYTNCLSRAFSIALAIFGVKKNGNYRCFSSLHYYLSILWLSISPEINAQTIYDTTQRTNTETTQTDTYSCNLSGNSVQGVTSVSACADFFWSLEGTVFNTSHLQMFSQTGFTDHGYYLDITGTYCNSGCDSNPQMVGWYQRGTYTSSGSIPVQSCPPSTNPTYTFMAEDSTDTKYCYQPQDLNDNDTCPAPLTPYPSTGLSTSSVCLAKSDGSRCKLNFDSVSRNYISATENDCYLVNHDEYTPPEVDPPDQCQTITTGNVTNTWCPADQSQVCDSQGVCPTGCGSFSYGGETAFGCFAQDPNEPNFCDQDGDGITDEACLTPSSGTEFDDSGIINAISQQTTTLSGAISSQSTAITGALNGLSSGISGLQAEQQITNTKLDDLKNSTDEIAGLLNTSFTAQPGRTATGINALFSASDIAEVEASIETMKTQINTYFTTINTDFAAIFSVPVLTDTFEAKTLEVYGQSLDISFSRWSSAFSWIGAAVMFAVTVISMSIILKGE